MPNFKERCSSRKNNQILWGAGLTVKCNHLLFVCVVWFLAWINFSKYVFFSQILHLDENEERSMVEPASLENIKLKELKEVTKNNDENFYLWNDFDVRTEAGCHDK